MKPPKEDLSLAVAPRRLSLAYSLGSIFNLFPHGVEGEWAWAYFPLPVSCTLLGPPLIAGAIIAIFS